MSSAPRPSVEDITRGGGVVFAAWHFQHRWSAEDTAAAVRRRWPQATDRTIQAIVNRGEQSAEAADILTAGGPSTRLPARDFPGPRSAVPNFRFVGRLILLNASGTEVDQYPFDLQGQDDVDQETLRNTVVAMYQAGDRQYGQRQRRYTHATGSVPGDLIVDFVERQYP